MSVMLRRLLLYLRGITIDKDGMRIVKNPVPFVDMYWSVKRRQGLSYSQILKTWQVYKGKNTRSGL